MNPEAQLRPVHPKGSKFIFASASKRYSEAVFGRDSIEVAEDLLEIKPEIAKDVILTLASLQGVERVKTSEEEPGRIHHEYRNLHINGRRVSRESEQILKDLSKRWGGTKEELLYYGSVDATPLYVCLVMDYCSRYGKDILDQPYTKKDGNKATVRESVLGAIHWIEHRIHSSSLGLIEYKRTNPQGIKNQVWKDSETAYIHTSGELANTEGPITPIEVQGYAYEALTKAADIMGPQMGTEALKWRRMADKLADSLKGFWLPREQYFAMGIDRNAKGKSRLIQTPSSNPALLLNTGIFDKVDEKKRMLYISAIVKTIMGPEFLTDAGVRCRAASCSDLVSFPDYHGTWAVWPKETYDIAKGLRRQNFPRLAEELEMRMINAVKKGGKNYEFFYVSPDGLQTVNDRLLHQGTNMPEDTQAWTISAVLASKYNLAARPPEEDTASWQYGLEQQLLKMIPAKKSLKRVA